MNENRVIENIPIEKIIPNIYQPRIIFDDKLIEELSKSIKNHGIIQPLILRKIGEKYEIIDGERRYKAAKKINIKSLPSIILNLEDKEAAELILMENMQKQLLTPIEEANAYQQIMFLNKFNIEELSKKIGKDKSTIENKLRLLTLHPIIQEALLNNKISEGHAKALTKVERKKEQEKLFNKIINERITVKKLEEIINQKENKKTEVEFMDNSQLNFNQYNNLLKEQEKPQMEATVTPSPIIENSTIEQKTNEFFPSLEEQPLNAEVPISFEENIPAMEMPQFVTSENSITAVEEPTLVQNVEAPAMEMPQIQNAVQMPEQVIEQPVVEVPQNNIPFEMPAFEVPTMQVPEPTLAQNVEAPVMEMPQIQNAVQMPEQVIEQPVVEVPQNNIPFEMPAFEVPTMQVPEPTLAQNVEAPVMEMPQIQNAVQMPEQVIEQPVVEVPQNNVPFEMPAFEVPTMQVPEPTLAQNVEAPVMEMPQIQNAVQMPEQVIEQHPTKDITPAINIIKNIKPLLETSGYNITLEETDTPNEYQIIIKVEK